MGVTPQQSVPGVQREAAVEQAESRPPCPICGGASYELGFRARAGWNGLPPMCATCKTVERHRIVASIYQALRPVVAQARALQFAPDGSLKKEWFKHYDFSIYGGHNSQDMTALDLPDAAYDLIVSNHVLEHVPDDVAAVRECLRVVGEGVVHVNVPSPTYRFQTLDWGFADPDKNEHHRDYGADAAVRLSRAAPDAHCLTVTGRDPVTESVDLVFFLSRSLTTLERYAHPLMRAQFGCVLAP